MNKIGVVSGSFDPITMGHIHVISKALMIVDTIHVIVANHPSKKYYFSEDERLDIALNSLTECLPNDVNRINVQLLPGDEFTAIYARELGANIIFRGIRNVVDFEYEHSQQLFNSEISPEVTTMYIMPPPELIQVSSSMIKSMKGMKDWKSKVTKNMPSYALNKLENKL